MGMFLFSFFFFRGGLGGFVSITVSSLSSS